jgi:hypothetical protein
MTAEELKDLDAVEAFYIKQEERFSSFQEEGFDEELLTSQEELIALNPLLDNVYFIEEEAGI